ncbi:MAG: PadR family transcriptional regulator [Oscillospiraceae bacterium]
MANEKKLDCVILGLLNDEDLTGYEIKHRMDTTLKMFWGASYGSIYPTLKMLEENRLAAKTEVQENGRKKNIYSITAKGRQHLKQWLHLPVEKDELRYETMLKLFFGDSVGEEITLQHIQAFEEKTNKELNFLLSNADILERIAEEDSAHFYYLQTARFGIKVFTAYLEWCKEAKQALQERQNG